MYVCICIYSMAVAVVLHIDRLVRGYIVIST